MPTRETWQGVLGWVFRYLDYKYVCKQVLCDVMCVCMRVYTCVHVCVCVSHSVVCIHSAIPWTIACQAPLSMKFSRQEYWSGLPFSSPRDIPKQGLNPGLLHHRQILYHLLGKLLISEVLFPEL